MEIEETNNFERHKLIVPNFIFGSHEHCTYCGEIPSSLDHVIPVSQFSDKDRRHKDFYNKGIRTYCCMPCNQKLGSKVFNTFLERVLHIREKIIAEAQKNSRTASWSDEEIVELDYTLQTYIASKQIQIRRNDLRSEWAFSYSFYQNIENLKTAHCLDESSPKYLEWVKDYFIGLNQVS
jgi:uncharacterized protein YlaI